MSKTYALALPCLSRLLALPPMTLQQAQEAQAKLAKVGKSVVVFNRSSI